MGWLLNWVEQVFHSGSKRMTISAAFVLLTVGISMLEFHIGPGHCGFSLLVVCMMLALCVPALATGDLEEVSITIFDEDGTVDEEAAVEAEAEAEPEPAVDPTLPVYQPDGSILITMSFTGDFTIGENVQASGTPIVEKELKKQNGDIHYPFRNIRNELLKDDLTMINFEGTLTTAGRNPDKRENSFLFRADPAYGGILLPNGVETVTLENNHVLDMGADEVRDALRRLDPNSMTPMEALATLFELKKKVEL